MIKYYCDVCNAKCSNDRSSGLIEIADIFCYGCHRELVEFYENMLRRNPDSYIHEIDKIVGKYEKEKENDSSIS